VNPVTNAGKRFAREDRSSGRDGACPSATVAVVEGQVDKKSKGRTRACAAFTLIEILIVIGIILFLAGLLLAVSGFVQEKGKRSRAEAEIAAMSAALESYKADNGVYPYTAATTTLTATQTDPSTYKTASLDFYKIVAADSDADGVTDTGQRSYFTFKTQMLGGPRDQNGNLQSVQFIRDPFGNAYGYSTSKNPIANPNASTAAGNNPTFDLWSTGGANDASKWIKNW
jgi:general secretion pathway protein G